MAKLVRIVGLGGFIWSLSLLWPEMNRVMPSPALLGLTAWLAMAALFYLIAGRSENGPRPQRRQPAERPSRPVPLLRN